MNHSESHRQGTPRRYEYDEDYSEIIPEHRRSAAYDHQDSSSRPGPTLVPRNREDRAERIDEEERVIGEHEGPSTSAPRVRVVSDQPEIIRIDPSASQRRPDRRATVEDEEDTLNGVGQPGPSSRPSRPEEHYDLDIEPGTLEIVSRQRDRRRYGAEDEYELHRRRSRRDDDPMVRYAPPPRPVAGYRPQPMPPSSSYQPGIRMRPPPPSGVGYAPPILPDFGYPPIPVMIHNRRRTASSGRPGPPHSPPPYGLPINDEERRQSRRHSTRHALPIPPPDPRPVPPGVVTPSPYLVSSYQEPPPSSSGEDHVGTGGGAGGGGGRGGHDLATLAGQPNPKDREKVRNSIVLCVYRHSKKAFDFRFVELRKSQGKRMDRDIIPPVSDLRLFKKMRKTYEKDLRGWIRRLLSFKHLSTVRLLQYGDGLFFRPKQEDDIFSSKFMRIWRNPEEELDNAIDPYEWNKWLLQQKYLEVRFDMAIELIEDYVPERIVLFVGFMLIGIAGLTAAWLIVGGEPGNVSTVMSFVLTFIAAVVALTGIWDWFDADRSKEIQQRAVMVLPTEYDNYDQFNIFGPGKKVGGKDSPRW